MDEISYHKFYTERSLANVTDLPTKLRSILFINTCFIPLLSLLFCHLFFLFSCGLSTDCYMYTIRYIIFMVIWSCALLNLGRRAISIKYSCIVYIVLHQQMVTTKENHYKLTSMTSLIDNQESKFQQTQKQPNQETSQ